MGMQTPLEQLNSSPGAAYYQVFIIHWFKHPAFTFTRAEGELSGVLLGAAADVSSHGPGPHPNHQAGHY